MQAFTVSASEIFRLHPHIRWASLVTKSGDIIFTQTREGFKSPMTEEGIVTFIEANRPNSILQACGNLSVWDGQVRSALVEYEKIFLFVMTIGNKVLAIGCDKTASHQEISQVANKFQAYVRARMMAKTRP